MPMAYKSMFASDIEACNKYILMRLYHFPLFMRGSCRVNYYLLLGYSA